MLAIVRPRTVALPIGVTAIATASVATAIALLPHLGPSIWTVALLPAVAAVWWGWATRLGRVEKALGESEARKAAILEAAPDAVVTVDHRGRVLEFNAAAERLFKHKRSRAARRPFTDLVVPGRRARVLRKVLARYLSADTTPKAHRIEVAARRADGSEFPAEVTLARTVAPNGGPVLVGFVRDLSAAKRADQALRESEERYRGLVEQAADAIFVLDSDGLIRDVNRRACDSLGYARGELIGRRMAEFEGRVPRTTAGAGETITLDRVHRRKDGTTFPVEVRLGRAEGEGKMAVARDVSARRRAEAAVRESEERYRHLFEAHPHPLWVYSPDTLRFAAVNQAAVNRYGYSRGEFLAMTILDLLPPDELDRERHPPDTSQAALGRHCWKYGTVRDVEVTTHAFDDGGRSARLVLAVDVTDRRQAERTLRDREDRYRRQQAALLELIQHGSRSGDRNAVRSGLLEVAARTLAVDRVSTWRFVGDRQAIRCEDLYERSADRHSDGIELSAADYPAYFAAIDVAEVIAAGDAPVDPRTIEFREGYLTPLGIGAMLDIPIRVGGRPWGVLCCEHVGPARPWAADEQVFALAVANLVALAEEEADRLRTESALRASEELLRNVLTHIPGGVFWKDRNSVYLGCNDLVARCSGVGVPANIVGKTDLDLTFDPAEAAFYRECDRRVMDSGIPLINVEESQTRADGIAVLLTSKVPLRDGAGTVVGVLGVYQDITERKRLEEQLRQAQKMEAIGRLAGGVAHDFNNLLTVINGFGQVVLDQLTPDDPARPLVEEIGKAGERAAGLTRQLLAFSRQQVVCPRVLDLNSVVDGAEQLLRRLIGEDVELSTSFAPDLGRVKADAGQIEQVLMNLAVNARDAMPTGGRLTLKTWNVEAGRQPHPDVPVGEYVVLAVADNGVGMDQATRGRIFEPFFTTKGVGKGTGLGLATVYGIVTQCGGHVTVDSTPGRGTTFDIYLPRVEDAAPKAAKRSVDEVLPRGVETILLVEDEPAVRALDRRVLASCGYTVLEAHDGREAVGIAERLDGRIDLLLSDVVMPHLGGRQLAEALQASRPGLKVLFVSGYTDDAVVRHGVGAEHAFLQKPFSPSGLARKVRDVLDQANTPN